MGARLEAEWQSCSEYERIGGITAVGRLRLEQAAVQVDAACGQAGRQPELDEREIGHS